MNLTENYKLEEFEHSDTAKREGIDNSVQDDITLYRIRLLCEEVLQPLHDLVGQITNNEYYIKITSGYRCKKLNKAVGGSSSSFHLFGYAADCELWIKIDGKWVEHNTLLFHLAKVHGKYTELIWEFNAGPINPPHKATPKWVHLAYSQTDKRSMIKYIS